jgi:exopolyphosphatase/guanosine-5'-triphosphate,3'-diphosphate pyrophosphatase
VTEVLAAVDVGTNSLHLVVARVGDDDRFDVITREREMVRLGTGSGDMKQLPADAIDRGVDALRRFRRIAEVSNAPVRAVATSAVREADNHPEFIRRARDEAGVDVEVISGVEEARLIHLGVLQALPVFDQRLLLCDIGGGSTELLVGERGETLAVASVKLGAVRLTNRFFASPRLHPSAVSSCRRHVAALLSDFGRQSHLLGHEVMVGSSGSIEQVAKLARAAGDDDEPHSWNGAVVTAADLKSVTAMLIEAQFSGTVAELPGIEARRADIALAGTLVLEGVFAACGVEELVLSDYALREGVLIDTAHRRRGGTLHHLRDVSRRGVEHLAEDMDEDPGHSAHVAHLALQLFDATASQHGLGTEAREYLEAAALLANVGLAISHSKHHKHSYYMIRNSDRLVGLTDREIELIAQIARYHRKGDPKPSHVEFAALSPDEQDLVRTCAAILRVAIGLDRGHESRVRSVQVEPRGDDLVVQAIVADGADVDLELYAASERSGLLAEVLGHPIELEAVTAS